MHKNLLFLALAFCLQVAAQPEYTDTFQEPPVRNIILLIGDGMGTAQLSAGLTASGGQLAIAGINNIGFSKTQPADGFITDSGAGGTAIATGYKTFDHAIGVDADTLPRTSILTYASQAGKATGLVVTSEVTHATPASFVAHQPSRYRYEEIAQDFLHAGIDVFVGGGRDHFEKRKDQANLSHELTARGFTMVYSLEEFLAIESGKTGALLYPEAPPRFSEGRGAMLEKSVGKALQLLNQDEDGFFLLVEGSQIDWGGHDNDTDYLLEELLDFDKAVKIALDFARNEGNTLVIVTADHETGGMSLLDGDLKNRDVQAVYASTHHSGEMVPVFAYGPGSADFRGIYENTALFTKMMKCFGFDVVE